MSAYKIFLEQSGLTSKEAYDFIQMKINELSPPKKDSEIDMGFINRISKEAQEWKKNGYPE